MTTEPTARIDAMSQVCAKSFDERRASPRQRRLNAAKIVFNNNASVIDCIVRDLSPQGARLIVASPVGIPERFDLRIDRKWRLPSLESNLEGERSDWREFLDVPGMIKSALLPQFSSTF
ncbi:MAG: PilZ domain-containing protein [Betaproteobacteria bacterium]|jgi:hypothetical protein